MREALAAQAGPVTPEQLAKAFSRGNAERIREIVDTLISLGTLSAWIWSLVALFFLGTLAMARTNQPDTNGSQWYITTAVNASTANLDGSYTVFGQIVEGMDVVDKLYAGYGRANVPDQARITAEGNKYLAATYPKLDYVKKATIEK